MSRQGTAPATSGASEQGPGPAPRPAESFGYFGRIGAQLSTVVTIASGVAYVMGVLVTDSYWRRLGTSPAAVGMQTAGRIAISGVAVAENPDSPVAERLDGRCVWILGDSADDDVVRDPAIGVTFTLPAGDLSFEQLKDRTRCPP